MLKSWEKWEKLGKVGKSWEKYGKVGKSVLCSEIRSNLILRCDLDL